jgi:uncharacterized protein YaeQ
MALPSTIHRFRIDLSDVDRGVYEQLEFQLARHPSETEDFTVARVLAFALEHREGLAFGKGLCVAEDPAVSVPDDQGGTALWIDIGAPSAERLHKASKYAGEVCVYTHKDIAKVTGAWVGKTIHRAERIRVVGLPAEVVQPLAERLGRSNAWSVLRTAGQLYVTAGGETFEGSTVERTALAP